MVYWEEVSRQTPAPTPHLRGERGENGGAPNKENEEPTEKTRAPNRGNGGGLTEKTRSLGRTKREGRLLIQKSGAPNRDP